MIPGQLTLFDETQPAPARRRPHIFQESEQRTTHPLQQRIQQPKQPDPDPQPSPTTTAQTPKPISRTSSRLPRPRSLREYLAHDRQYAQQASSPKRTTAHYTLQAFLRITTCVMALTMALGGISALVETNTGNGWTSISGWLLLMLGAAIYLMIALGKPWEVRWKMSAVLMLAVIGCGWAGVHQINAATSQYDTATRQVVQEMAKQQRVFFAQHGQWASNISQLPKPRHVNGDIWQETKLSLQSVLLPNKRIKTCVQIDAAHQLPVSVTAHSKQLCAAAKTSL